MRILDREEIGKVLEAAGLIYRPILATAIFTGLRQGELLGLTWADVDFDAGLVRVRKQLGRDGVRVEPKTAQAVRDVVMMPALGRLLRAHKLASPYSGAADPVFASSAGTPHHYRNIGRRGLEKAVERAAIPAPNPRFHDLRHTAASLLVAEGLNVVFVSRQLGHASPDITLRVYAHLFDRAEHGKRASDALEAGFGHLLATEERSP
jgi:integrase